MNYEEKRKFYRVNCNLDIEVSGDGKKVRAESVDISETGFRLRSHRRFTPYTRYELCFTLSPKLANIKCVATVVWVNKVDDSDIFITGFTFSELSQKDLLSIRQFIEEKGKNEDE